VSERWGTELPARNTRRGGIVLEPDASDDRSAVAESAVRLIGENFVQRGLVTPEQLATALAEQQSSMLPLGEILVAHGWVTRLDLASILSEHWDEKGAAPHAESPLADNGFDLDQWLVHVDAPAPSTVAVPPPRSDATQRSRSVLFIPTAAGYRLIELGATPP